MHITRPKADRNILVWRQVCAERKQQKEVAALHNLSSGRVYQIVRKYDSRIRNALDGTEQSSTPESVFDETEMLRDVSVVDAFVGEDGEYKRRRLWFEGN